MGHSDRIGILESALVEMRQKFEKLELKAKRGPDDSFKRIVFLGMPKMLYEKRIQYLERT